MMVRGTALRYLIVLVTIALIIGGWFAYRGMTAETKATVVRLAPAPSQLPSVSPVQTAVEKSLYKPALIQIDDQVGTMKVVKRSEGDYGGNSIGVIFDGRLSLKGTFVHAYEEIEYIGGKIIFTADAVSSGLLPQAQGSESDHVRMELLIDDTAQKELFGPAGSKGEASVEIDRYFTVSADILEGVSNSAKVNEATITSLVLPPSPEINNAEFDHAIKDFQKLSVSGDQVDKQPPADIQSWLEHVDKTIFVGLQSSEKHISSNQRERVRSWLLQAFTAQGADQLLGLFVPKVEDGYIISGGLSGLLPTVPYSGFKDIVWIKRNDNHYIYEVTYKMTSGTYHWRVRYDLTLESGEWRINSYKGSEAPV